MVALLGVAVLLLLAFSIEAGNVLDTARFCKSFVECHSVALVEERHCLGNTLKRPFWLIQRNDPHGCHDKLRSEYITLDELESQLDNAFLACLTENAQPLTSEQRQSCTSEVLLNSPKFYYGRTIAEVPTNCFMGVERRRERECSTVKECCGTYDRCYSILTTSETAKTLEERKKILRQRAKDCEVGKDIQPLPVLNIPNDQYPSPPVFAKNNDVEESWAPTGHINVRVTDEESERKKNREQQEEDQMGHVNVRFTTAEERAERHALKMLLRAEPNDGASNNLGDESSPEEGPTFVQAKFPLQNNRPTLNFPQAGIPTDIREHNEKFDQAMRNLNKVKESTAEIANEGINSLMGAARVSKVGVASGLVHKLENMGEEMNLVPAAGDFVTSRPLILVAKEQKEELKEESKQEKKKEEKQPNREAAGGCRAFGTKTAKIEKILGMLGEKEDSRDMAEIKALINDWHNVFRKRLLSAKERSKSKEIMDELERLVKHFDDVNLKLIRTQVDAEFSQEDYPTEDADITANECDPLPPPAVSQERKGKIGGDEEHPSDLVELETQSNSTTLLDEEHGEQILVDDGVTKILLPGGTELEMSRDESNKEDITHFINEEYKKEMETFRSNRLANLTSPVRNDTTCDAYMRCRAQMHLAVDGCAWKFASGDLLSSLTESAESLLYRDEGPCDPKQQPMYEQLYEMLIRRNTHMRTCLDQRNDQFFSSAVCVPYDEDSSKRFESSLKRVLANDYQEAVACYHDANRIQEKCTLLRECCPNFDECREETFDVELEQTIISNTARINEGKQECIREKARDAFKETLRGLLSGKGDILSKLKKGRLGLDISRGARLLRLRK